MPLQLASLYQGGMSRNSAKSLCKSI